MKIDIILPKSNLFDNDISIKAELFIGNNSIQFQNQSFIFCHGLGANRLYWKDVATIMANEGYTSVIYELRGHGENFVDYFAVNTRSLKSQGIKSNADDLQYIISYFDSNWISIIEKGLNATNDTHDHKIFQINPWKYTIAVGHSYGGNIVIELASRSPLLPNLMGIICVDGGFINLQRKYPEYSDCVLALSPRGFIGVYPDQLEHIIRTKWCVNWPESGIQAMLANFDIGLEDQRTRKPVEPRLSYPLHMQLLHDLWLQRPSSLYPSLNIPVLFLAVGSLNSTLFSANKLEDIKEAVRMITAKDGLNRDLMSLKDIKKQENEQAIDSILTESLQDVVLKDEEQQNISITSTSSTTADSYRHNDDQKENEKEKASMESDVFDSASQRTELNLETDNNKSNHSKSDNNTSSISSGDKDVIPIYEYSSTRVRVRWMGQAGHDAPAQFPNEVADIILTSLNEGFFWKTRE